MFATTIIVVTIDLLFHIFYIQYIILDIEDLPSCIMGEPCNHNHLRGVYRA